VSSDNILVLSRGLVDLQCLLRVVIKQDVEPPPLLPADVVELELHSWKHLLRLLRERENQYVYLAMFNV